MEWIKEAFLICIGLSAGITVAGGIFAFIIGLGIVSDFADRTHTGKHILLYEDAVAWGGIVGNIVFIYQIPIGGGTIFLSVLGLLAGIFTGAWAMALAEMLNVFPIFVRRIHLRKCVPWVILAIALGRGVGAMLFFTQQWGGV